jgi:hypothetical protein
MKKLWWERYVVGWRLCVYIYTWNILKSCHLENKEGRFLESAQDRIHGEFWVAVLNLWTLWPENEWASEQDGRSLLRLSSSDFPLHPPVHPFIYFRLQEVTFSNLGPEAGYPQRHISWIFAGHVDKFGMLHQTGPLPLPSIPFPNKWFT